jgi:NACHT domain
MTVLELFRDPNLQKFWLPVLTGLVSIVTGWAVNQLPPLQKTNQGWRVLKLLVETAILVVVLSSLPDALETVKASDKQGQLVGLTYGVVLLGLASVIGFDFWQLVRKKPSATESSLEQTPLAKNRQTLMDKVRIKAQGTLNHSLYQAARMDLGLEDCPEMVGLQWQTAGQSRQVLPKGTRLLDRLVALGSGGTLLVLGEPGAGKTTLLMELATDWLDCTDAKQEDQAIPVVLSLSSWGTYRLADKKNPTFVDWLLEEIFRQYQLRPQVGRDWLNKGGFVLLLDGLDEVREPLRNVCVAAINQFRREFGTIEMAVCSRIADFQNLTTELETFQAAVFIQPLEERQIEDYLQQAGTPLKQVRMALQQDATLLELARTPLFLWILSLAYSGRSANELLNLPQPERRRRLFDRYIEQMFLKRPLSEGDRQRMIRWLSILAQHMGTEKEFLIERMQPLDWLVKTKYKWLYRLIGGLLVGLIGGLLVGLIGGLLVGLIGGLLVGLFGGLLIFGLLINNLDAIYLIEAIEISISSVARREFFSQVRHNLIFGLIVGLIGGLIFGLSTELLAGLIGGLIGGLIFSLIVGLIGGLIFGLSAGLLAGLITGLIVGLIVVLKADIQNRVHPNQGIWNSLQNMLFICSIAIILTLILYLFLVNFMPIILGQTLAKSIMISTLSLPIFMAFIVGGGMACVQHFSLRLVLYHSHQIPWNFVTFFKQAEVRLFIQRTGGSYSFIHRYLQEHFASLTPATSFAPKSRP